MKNNVIQKEKKPCKTDLSCAAAFRVFPASKVEDGYTQVAPAVTVQRLPNTIPKQWYRGTGIQMLVS